MVAVLVIFALSGLLVGCDRAGRTADIVRDRPQVVATTTIVGDIVARVGGEDIDLRVLLPPGADPHGYIFRPVDMTAAADADVLFVNGAGLEGHLDRLVRTAGTRSVIALDRGIDVRRLPRPHTHDDHGHHDCQQCATGATDPHFWFDPLNVKIWATTIADALTEIVPDRQAAFEARAAQLQVELDELHEWIQQQVKLIPPERRLLASDHKSFGYFADRYEFTEVGVILPSFDSMAQASARHVGQLMDALRAQEIPAIFIGMNVNPNLAERISRDSGVELVRLHTESLTDDDGTAPDYFAYMRYNVRKLVQHLGVAATP